MVEYIVFLGVGFVAMGVIIGAVLFYKWKKPKKKVEESVAETEFGKDEGPTIEYDRGMGGSPYYGKITKLVEHGGLVNATILDEDKTELTLYNLDAGKMGNLKIVSSLQDLMHGRVKMLCNKDSTGEIKVNADGTVWSVTERTENAVLANLMAERRSYSKALKDSDEMRQLAKLRAPSFYAEHLEEKSFPVEKYRGDEK